MLLSTRGSCSLIIKSKNICVIVCNFHGSLYSTCWDIAALLSHSIHISIHYIAILMDMLPEMLKIELALWHQLKNLAILLT